MYNIFRRAIVTAGSALLFLSGSQAFAGAQASADKEIATQQATADNAFPLHFSLSVGGESEFVFRGVDILPEVDVSVPKALTEAINSVKNFQNGQSLRQFLSNNGFPTPKSFVSLLAVPRTPVEASRENGIYYVDGSMSGYGFTLGIFYATQSESRDEHNFFGKQPIFDEYHEFDSQLSYSHLFGPVRVSLGGTYYHVINNTDFDTAELNFGVSYTPPQFHYISASFSYNYAGAFNYPNYNFDGVKGSYLDGHYLEARLDGDIPLYKNVIKLDPYILVSAGSGIMPRAFNPGTVPTYFNTERYSKAAAPFVEAIFASKVNPNAPAPSSASTITQAAQAAFDPSTLDRSFDLSNFQVGVRVPIFLTRFITLRGDFNYSRPLGNLDREPYNQKDQIWGGGTVSFQF